jgi:exopolysaccharide production protein ExoZ
MLLQFMGGVWLGWLHTRRPIDAGWLLPLGIAALFVFDANALTRGLAACMILAGALSMESRMPRLSLLKRLGDASYSVYLFHGGAATLAAAVIKRLPLYGWPQFVLLVGGCFTGAAVVGLLAHHYIERPLLRRLSSNRRLRARPATAQA